MAQSLVEDGKPDKAQKYYEKALEIDPDNECALNNLANVLSGHGRAKEALKYLRYTTEMYPDSVEAWINLGNSYEEASDLDEATKCYNKAKASDPGQCRSVA